MMKVNRRILLSVLTVSLFSIVVNAQSDVVVEKDKFSGSATIKLQPQKLIDKPDHQLTIAASSKVGGKLYTGLSDADDTIIFHFVSSNNDTIEFGDKELHFLVDGKPLKGGPTAGGMLARTTSDDQTTFKFSRTFTGGLTLSKLQQISRSSKVEMRLGAVEVSLDTKTLGNFAEFVNKYKQLKAELVKSTTVP